MQLKVLVSGLGEGAANETEAEGDILDAPAKPLMQELLAQAKALKANIAGFSQLAPKEKAESKDSLATTLQGFLARTKNQELPQGLAAFVEKLQGLLAKLQPQTEPLPKHLAKIDGILQELQSLAKQTTIA